MKGNLRNRQIHFWTGGIALFFLTITTVTGILWAYAPYMYWQPGYKQKQEEVRTLDKAEMSSLVSPSEVLENVQNKMGVDAKIHDISIAWEADQLVYRVRIENLDGKKSNHLMNARLGQWLSPLTENQAIRFAQQYLPSGTQVLEAELLDNWIHRKKSSGRAAWRIMFRDSRKTEIFLDPDTGLILEDQDRTRRFHWWVMRLHQFNFFGTNKILSIISGLPLLILLVSGLVMLWRRLKRPSSRKKRLKELKT